MDASQALGLAQDAGVLALFAVTPWLDVPATRLRDELARRGFTDCADVRAGRGNALLARKAGGA